MKIGIGTGRFAFGAALVLLAAGLAAAAPAAEGLRAALAIALRATGGISNPGAASSATRGSRGEGGDEPWWFAALPSADRARLQELMPNIPYDGRLTFVRLSYELPMRFGFGGRGGGGRCYGGPIAWLHDYPCAERNLAHVLREVSLVRPYVEGGNIYEFGDPELFKFPIAYMSEPGYWRPTDQESNAFREYVLKGGFVIFDDFRGRDWYAFESAVLKALPEAQLVRLDGSEKIFRSFFEIESLENFIPPYNSNRPEWWGVFEGNDRSKRLMIVASFNNDLGDYWEYSGTGWHALDMTNEALKLGINYMIYGMLY
jgi:hypothetical protein